MKGVRYLIFSLASVVGAWLLVSFVGAMVDRANAAFWSSSLMWALLSSLTLAPVLLAHDAFSGSQESPDTQERSPSRASPPRSDEAPDRTDFVDEEPGDMRTLWPTPQAEPDQEERPSQEDHEDQQRVRTSRSDA